MKEYVKAEIQVIVFEAEDVIMTSSLDTANIPVTPVTPVKPIGSE